MSILDQMDSWQKKYKKPEIDVVIIPEEEYRRIKDAVRRIVVLLDNLKPQPVHPLLPILLGVCIALTIWVFYLQNDVKTLKAQVRTIQEQIEENPIEKFIYNVEPKRKKPAWGFIEKEE